MTDSNRLCLRLTNCEAEYLIHQVYSSFLSFLLLSLIVALLAILIDELRANPPRLFDALLPSPALDLRMVSG